MMNPLACEKRPVRTHDEPGSRPTMKPVWRLIGSFGQDQFAQFGRLQAVHRAVVADGHRLFSLQQGAAVDGGGGARCRRCIVDARVGAQRSRRLGGGAKHGRGAGHGGWHGVVLCSSSAVQWMITILSWKGSALLTYLAIPCCGSVTKPILRSPARWAAARAWATSS